MKVYERTIFYSVTVSLSLKFLKKHVEYLDRRGWRVLVSASEIKDDPYELSNSDREEQIQTILIPMEREINLAADLASFYRLLLAYRDAQPTITNVGTPKAGLLGGLAALASRVPIRIYTLHGLRMETAVGAKRQLLMSMERLAMACAHRVVCVSPSLRERVHELRLAPAHKTVVLGAGSMNGVPLPDLAAALPMVATLRETLQLPANVPVVGFVGRFVRDKGMIELMAAYRQVLVQLPDARLLLVGDYEVGDPIPAEVQYAIESDHSVIRVGFVPDVTPYYLLMNVLALPTYREGLGLVALEAAAAGIPTITTNATGARDAVLDGTTGWQVPIGNSSALATALMEALSQPEKTLARGQAGKKRVQQEFNPQVMQIRWEKFYQELLTWSAASQENRIKRTFEVLISAFALLAFGFPLLALALLVRLRLGSPVLFRQVRPGLCGQPFTMYKFRTMIDKCDSDGNLLPDSQRLTPFGRWLRSTSLDELPELVNVFRGEMSLVGPRPLLTRYTPYFTAEEGQRLNVRPGITGWAQVNGRNTVSWNERLALDVWYVQHRSALLDLKILWLTLGKIFQRSGVVVDPESVMQNLDDERRGRASL